jgi:carbon starvation protein CstA
MTVLFLSTRRDGRSLGDIVRAEMGPVAGAMAGIGILLICIILLAVLALVVVQALLNVRLYSSQFANNSRPRVSGSPSAARMTMA